MDIFHLELIFIKFHQPGNCFSQTFCTQIKFYHHFKCSKPECFCYLKSFIKYFHCVSCPTFFNISIMRTWQESRPIYAKGPQEVTRFIHWTQSSTCRSPFANCPRIFTMCTPQYSSVDSNLVLTSLFFFQP